jgi:deazaflavin-dependent oxidoreductase (nitroreductase family)
MSASNVPATRPFGGDAVSTKSRILRALGRLSAGTSRPLAGRRFFGLWGIVHHVGRRSGMAYATPVVILGAGDELFIPLPFGPSTQWPRNVLAADGCRIRWRGRDYHTVAPEVVERSLVLPGVNPILRALIPIVGIRHFLRLREE